MEKRICLNDQEKSVIGLECVVCGSTSDLEYHHKAPFVLSNDNSRENLVCLCSNCHAAIHTYGNKQISRSQLTKEGLKRAKERGIRLGAQPGKRLKNSKIVKAFPYIKQHSRTFGGEKTDQELIMELQLSSNTFYKYKFIVKNYPDLESYLKETTE